MKRNVTQEAILAERMKRQRISEPVSTEDAYAQLFRNLQPVSPIAYSRPGSPTCLEHRVTFNDRTLTDRWRSKWKIIKGRFQRGLLGYILQEDLETYANAFGQAVKRAPRHQMPRLKDQADSSQLSKTDRAL